MKVTVRDVAKAANVSRGTVDRALHHRPGVNAQVAEKILKIADELGYQPDMAARTLASKKYIKTIGILLCSEGNPFFDDVIQGVSDALKEMEQFGIRGSIKTIKGFHLNQQLTKLNEFKQEKIGGLIITPVNSPEIAKEIQELENAHIPVTTINTDVSDTHHFLYVGCDYVKSGRVAGGMLGLLSNGSKERIAIVIGSKMVMAQAQRLEGIEQSLRQEYDNITIEAILENEDDEDLSYQLIKELLQKNHDLTAICFASAGVKGGLRAVLESDYRNKPRIITYDLTNTVKENLEAGVITASVCQEPYRQGYLGVNLLSRYLLFGEHPKESVVNTQISLITKYNL